MLSKHRRSKMKMFGKICGPFEETNGIIKERMKF